MKKLVSPILDPESVPLRINFNGNQTLSDEQVASSVETLSAQLDAWPDRMALHSEVVLLHHDKTGVLLLVGWVQESESHLLFHSVERSFPNAISAHLGNDALEQELAALRLPATSRRQGFEWIPGRFVADRDGVPKLVKPFWHSRGAVRVAEFERFVEETGFQTTAELQSEGPEYEHSWRKNALLETLTASERSDMAVTRVSKVDALAYCEWASARLPTEQEWLAVHITDWCPLDEAASELNAKRERLFQYPSFGHQGGWWTSTIDPDSGKSIVRYGGGDLLERDWTWTRDRVECDPEYTELLVSFDVVKDV